MADATGHPEPDRDPHRHRWLIPTDEPWAIGRENGTAEIGLPDLGLADRHATVRWTGDAVEVRAVGPHEPPRVRDVPVRHARVPVGEQFTVGAHTLMVSGPAEVSLHGVAGGPTTAASGCADERWEIPAGQVLTIGLANDQSGITVSQTGISNKLLTVGWTDRGVEIRAAAPGTRPVVDGQPVVHARRHVGQRFSISDHEFEVSGPAEITLVHRPIAAAVAMPPTLAPTPPTPAGYRRWTVPTRQSVTIGREGGPAEIGLSGLDLAQRHATVSWTGSAIEIRSTAPQARPFVNGKPVLHARIPVGDEFMIGSHTLVVSAPNEIALVPAQVTATEPALRFADVSLRYRGRTEPTLKNLSFELALGEVLAVIGPSGAGKSTMCSGLLGEVELTSGSMVLGHVNLAASRMQASHLVSFVPQQPTMFGNLGVRESLTWVARLRLAADTGLEERAQRVEKVIADMELTGEVDKRVDTLSGGQGKRVSTAMELLSDPLLLVLDEPTSGLDEGLDRTMMDSLRAVAAKDCAVIVVTHSMVNLDRADKVLAITGRGRLAFFGPPVELLGAFDATSYAEVMDGLRAGSVTAAPPQVSQTALGGATLTASPPTRGSLSRHLPRLVGRELARQRNSARQLAAFVVVGILLTAGLAFAVQSVEGLGGVPSDISSVLIALIVCLTFFSMAQSFATIVEDRDVIERESRWSISPASVILARAITCAPPAVILGVLSIGVYLLIMPRAPLDPVLPHPAGLLLFAVLLPLASMAIGLLISTLSKSLRQAVYILMGVLVLQVIMTGLSPRFVAWPGEVLRNFSYLTPSRWAAAGLGADTGIHPMPVDSGAAPTDLSPFEDAIWTHDAKHVYTAAGALMIITVVSLGVTIWVLRKHLLKTR